MSFQNLCSVWCDDLGVTGPLVHTIYYIILYDIHTILYTNDSFFESSHWLVSQLNSDSSFFFSIIINFVLNFWLESLSLRLSILSPIPYFLPLSILFLSSISATKLQTSSKLIVLLGWVLSISCESLYRLFNLVCVRWKIMLYYW